MDIIDDSKRTMLDDMAGKNSTQNKNHIEKQRSN